MKILNAIVTAAFAAVTVPALADSGQMNMNHGSMNHAAMPMAKMSAGMIKKVDKAGGKITIAHGPLENLNMPPMTMAFAVKDKAMLDRVKAGDKVSFVADDVNGALTVTQLENAK